VSEHEGWQDSGDRLHDIQERVAAELKRQNDLQERAMAAQERDRKSVGEWIPAKVTDADRQKQRAVDRMRAVLSLARELFIHRDMLPDTALNDAEVFVDEAETWAEADGKKHGYDHRNPFGAR
jgi:hypothetical protein